MRRLTSGPTINTGRDLTRQSTQASKQNARATICNGRRRREEGERCDCEEMWFVVKNEVWLAFELTAEDDQEYEAKEGRRHGRGDP
jgi:hypothetical protein